MLVITYTFDHNHPWMTHRNVLAGSNRQVEKVNTSEKENSDQMPENSRLVKDQLKNIILQPCFQAHVQRFLFVGSEYAQRILGFSKPENLK